MKKKLTTGFAMGALMTGMVGIADASIIGSFDSSRISYAGGVFATGNYNYLRNELAARGDSISTISTLTADSLAGIDVFYTSCLSWTDGALTSAEQSALKDWVGSGGTLFSAGEYDWMAPTYNTFLDPFGITITGQSSNNATVIDTTSQITNGPNGVVTSLTFAASGYFLPGDYNTLAVSSDGYNVLIQKNYGSGQIVAVGDHNLFIGDYAINPNAEALFLNAVDSKPQPVPIPATIVLFGTGLAGLGGARVCRKKRCE